MNLTDWLTGVKRLYIETAPLIYYIETHSTYIVRMDAIVDYLEDNRQTAYSSAITLTEVLVHPIKSGNGTLAQAYRDILLHSTTFHLLPITARVGEVAADLRARYNLRTPDALHLAAAVENGCDGFLTNDAQLTRVTDIAVQTLDALELNSV